MPVPSPFHPRTAALCTSFRWKEWAGYLAVSAYDTNIEPEYYALRHAAGLLDVSPLFKYEITGPDAGLYLARLLVRDICRLKVGQVAYCCWCDDDGKILDDGTVTRLGERHYRVTAAEPAYTWFQERSRGFEVQVEDSSDRLAALALQGPHSRAVLKQISEPNIDALGFFDGAAVRLDGFEAYVTRTGYTGDLGYEIWVESERALPLWDRLMATGKPYGITPVGLDALDIARVEAGFIMSGVDYFNAHHCLIESQKSTPYELDLGWLIDLDREPFIGQAALQADHRREPAWALVGLEIDWDELERLYDEFGLPPHLPLTAWRAAVPLYVEGRQVGQATSGAWSPTLKKNLALGSVLAAYGRLGTRLQIEVTVEYQRRVVTATVVKRPFFNPDRKRS
jgi:aminomethyltransferase